MITATDPLFEAQRRRGNADRIALLRSDVDRAQAQHARLSGGLPTQSEDIAAKQQALNFALRRQAEVQSSLTNLEHTISRAEAQITQLEAIEAEAVEQDKLDLIERRIAEANAEAKALSAELKTLEASR